MVTSSQTSSGTCPLVITRTYVITDACGNSATVTHTISVDDNTAPVITGTIAPITIEGCTSADAPAPLTTVALEAQVLLSLMLVLLILTWWLVLHKLLPVLVHW